MSKKRRLKKAESLSSAEKKARIQLLTSTSQQYYYIGITGYSYNHGGIVTASVDYDKLSHILSIGCSFCTPGISYQKAKGRMASLALMIENPLRVRISNPEMFAKPSEIVHDVISHILQNSPSSHEEMQERPARFDFDLTQAANWTALNLPLWASFEHRPWWGVKFIAELPQRLLEEKQRQERLAAERRAKEEAKEGATYASKGDSQEAAGTC